MLSRCPYWVEIQVLKAIKQTTSTLKSLENPSRISLNMEPNLFLQKWLISKCKDQNLNGFTLTKRYLKEIWELNSIEFLQKQLSSL